MSTETTSADASREEEKRRLLGDYHRGQLIFFRQQLDVLRRESRQEGIQHIDLNTMPELPFNEVALYVDFPDFWSRRMGGIFNNAYDATNKLGVYENESDAKREEEVRSSQRKAFSSVETWMHRSPLAWMDELQKGICIQFYDAVLAFDWVDHPEKFKRLHTITSGVAESAATLSGLGHRLD